MNSERIFTRKRLGLDNNIWIVMVVTAMLSATLPAYKLISKTDATPCIAPKILVNGFTDAYASTKTFKTNELIWFRTPVAPGIEITWDFGDSTKTEEGFTSKHIFTKPSLYTVRVIINGECITMTKIIIKDPAPTVKDSVAIIGNDQVLIGDCSFYTAYEVDSYKWVIENNSNFTPQYTKTCTFKFRTAGTYIIKLVLNNDPEKTYRKDIVVTDPAKGSDEAPHNLIPDDFTDLPEQNDNASNQDQLEQNTNTTQTQSGQVTPTIDQPTEDVPPVKRKIAITDRQLKVMLEEVLANAMHPQDFDRYLCSGITTKVYVNDEKKPITFSELCERLQGNEKKIAIESTTIVRDPDNKDCETNLAVKYKKKGIRLF